MFSRLCLPYVSQRQRKLSPGGTESGRRRKGREKPTVGPIPTGAGADYGTCAETSVVRLRVTSGKDEFQLREVAWPQRASSPSMSARSGCERRRRGGCPVCQWKERQRERHCLGCPRRGATHDQREDFEAEAYLDLGIDTFAAEEIEKYLNPEANGDVEERSIFGFDFSYRLLSRRRGAFQVGYTVRRCTVCEARTSTRHGSPNVPSCKETIADFAGNIGEEASLYMLRNATSLEAYVGVVRVSAAQHRRDTCGIFYVETVQPGFLSVSGGRR